MMRNLWIAFAVLVFGIVPAAIVVSSSASAATTTRTLTASQASYTVSSTPDLSFSSKSSLRVSKGKYATYLAFPAVHLDAGQRITKAVLQLRISKTQNTGTGGILARATGSSWEAATLARSNAPSQLTGNLNQPVAPVAGTTASIPLDVTSLGSHLTSGVSLRLHFSTAYAGVWIKKSGAAAPRLVVTIGTDPVPTTSTSPTATSSPKASSGSSATAKATATTTNSATGSTTTKVSNLAATPVTGSSAFSIAVIPDTQTETKSATDTRAANRTQWLVDNKSTLNLKYVLDTGDQTSWGAIDLAQYQRSVAAMGKLKSAGIPYSIAIGNRDTSLYGWNGVAGSKLGGDVRYASSPQCTAQYGANNCTDSYMIRQTQAFKTYFPVSSLQNVGGTYESGKPDNVWTTFTAGGSTWLVLTLEMYPRTAVVNWAATVVATHPDDNVIVQTHSYLTDTGAIATYTEGYGSNSPSYLYANLIKKYSNIKFVFSAHVGTATMRTDTGTNGNTIISYLGTFQTQDTNPVRIVTINPDASTVTSSVVSPATGETLSSYATSNKVSVIRTTSSSTEVANTSGDGKLVFAHYFPPYPISIDNADPSNDYYARNYLVATGENSKFANVGGLLRDRPLTRSPLSGDYQLTDLETEITQAKNAGIDGFAVDILNLSGANWTRTQKLIQAAETVGGFKIMLQPDMTSINPTQDQLASALASLADSDAVYKLSTGQVVISPFKTETKSAAWWSQMLSLMQSSYGVKAKLLPLFLDPSDMADYASISYGFGNWGERDPAAIAASANQAAKAHALGKVWMAPVSVQDVRPSSQVYWEAGNTDALRTSWNRAISDDADLVLLTTWNDYSEGTSFAPSVDHGYSFLDISKYYLTQFKTGTTPTITDDTIYLTHRIQKASALPAYSGVMVQRKPSPYTPARDTVEVLTFLKAAATVTVNVGGTPYSYQATAGVSTKTFPLASGYTTASAIRSGTTVATVTTKDPVLSSITQQDLSYHAVSSSGQ